MGHSYTGDVRRVVGGGAEEPVAEGGEEFGGAEVAAGTTQLIYVQRVVR